MRKRLVPKEEVGGESYNLMLWLLGINLKKIQQELRVSKKAEQIAKDKLV